MNNEQPILKRQALVWLAPWHRGELSPRIKVALGDLFSGSITISFPDQRGAATGIVGYDAERGGDRPFLVALPHTLSPGDTLCRFGFEVHNA